LFIQGIGLQLGRQHVGFLHHAMHVSIVQLKQNLESKFFGNCYNFMLYI